MQSNPMMSGRKRPRNTKETNIWLQKEEKVNKNRDENHFANLETNESAGDVGQGRRRKKKPKDR